MCVCVIQGAWRLSLPSETKLYVTFVGTDLRRCGVKENQEIHKNRRTKSSPRAPVVLHHSTANAVKAKYYTAS